MMRADRRRAASLAGTAMLLAALVYANSFGNGFAFDDVAIIQQNSQVHGLAHLFDAITGSYWPTGTAERGLFRPLTLATYAFDWSVGGGVPFGFHFGNILLHAAVTGLVFLLLLELAGDLAAAWIGALVFAVHPVHVEAVANIVGRAETLTALFFLAACLVFLRAAKPHGWRSAALLGLFYFLALGSKENAIMLPAVLLLASLWRTRDLRTAAREALRSWRAYTAMALALGLYFVLRRLNIGTFLGVEMPPWFFGMPGYVRILTAIRVWPEYLRLMLVPVDLVPDYGPAVIVPQTSLFAPLVLMGLATGAIVALVAWRARRRAPLLTAGIVWFAVTVLPVSGLLFPVGVILAERTLYLPSVGVAVAAAALVIWARSRARAWRPIAAALPLVLFAGCVRTWTATPVWHDTRSVIDYLFHTHPYNYRVQWAEAGGFAAQGDTAGALAHFKVATRMARGSYLLRLDYGRLLAAAGRYQAAAAQFDTARQVIPNAVSARIDEADALLSSGFPDSAAAILAQGMNGGEEEGTVYYVLYSRALARAGHYAQAVHARKEALRLEGDSATWDAWGHLAGVALFAGDTATASEALRRARIVAPDDVKVPSLAEFSSEIRRRGPASIPLW